MKEPAFSALQVLFLLYHYFNAREIYNAIRVFIAGYVWMTGYGNFLYYYHYKDFSLGRCDPMPCSPLAQHACFTLASPPGTFRAFVWPLHVLRVGSMPSPIVEKLLQHGGWCLPESMYMVPMLIAAL